MIPLYSKVDQMSFAERRQVLELLVESDGHRCVEISKALDEKGIQVGATALAHYWRAVQERLRKGDVILMELVKTILAEKLQKAKQEDEQ